MVKAMKDDGYADLGCFAFSFNIEELMLSYLNREDLQMLKAKLHIYQLQVSNAASKITSSKMRASNVLGVVVVY